MSSNGLTFPEDRADLLVISSLWDLGPDSPGGGVHRYHDYAVIEVLH